MNETSWSLGVLIGLPVLAVLTLLCVVIGSIFAVKWFQMRGDYNPDYTFGAVVFLLCGLVFAVVTAWSFYPYEAEYHQWRTVSGEVTDVNSRILGTDGNVNQRFVVEIGGQEYGCDDTRCATVEPGDTLTLSCKREWQYTGIDGYGCNFIRNES